MFVNYYHPYSKLFSQFTISNMPSKALTAFANKKKGSWGKKKPVISDSIKKYVKRTLDSRIENKVANFWLNGTRLFNISNNIADFRNNNIFFLSPQLAASNGVTISQGIEQNQRIGNIVNIKKANIRLVLYPGIWEGTPTFPVNVNMYIFSTRKAGSISQLRTQIETEFFQLGDTSLPLTGTLDDNVLMVNNNSLQFHKRICFKLGTSQNDTNLSGMNNDYKLNIMYNIDVTKYLKKRYTFEDSDNEAYDKYTICMFSVVPADNTLLGTNTNLCDMSYNYEIEYEDA